MPFVLDPDGSPTPIYYPEDNEFLNEVDMGYIGFTSPQIEFHVPTALEHLQAIQGDWPDKDNDPASPEQAWA